MEAEFALEEFVVNDTDWPLRRMTQRVKEIKICLTA